MPSKPLLDEKVRKLIILEMRKLDFDDIRFAVFHCAFLIPEGLRFSEADVRLLLDEINFDTRGLGSAISQHIGSRVFLEEVRDGQSVYRLVREARLRHSKRFEGLSLDSEPELVTVSSELEFLERGVTNAAESTFLQETLSCLQVKANRAAIVMGWNLAYYHVRSWIISKHLVAFNAGLTQRFRSKNKTYDAATCHDDFPDSEHFVLTVCRDCGILDKNRFQLLEHALSDRNKFAHPSSRLANSPIAVGYVANLVGNVVAHEFFEH